jgi:hypothetical protein
MHIVTIVNKKSDSPGFMQERITRRLRAYSELTGLDMIDAVDKCIDIAFMWHRLNAAVKAQLLQSRVSNFLKIYRG